MPPSLSDSYEVVIEPGRGGLWGTLVECWQGREILYFLVWRDVKVRYKQTLLGFAWALLQPLITMLVFTLVFNRVAGIEAGEGVPYPVFAFGGLLPWILFRSSLNQASQSMVAEARLLTKVYFPRLLVPLSALGSSLVDFALSLLVLGVLCVVYGVRPGASLLFMPLFVLLTLLSSFAIGVWLSALNARYRDFRYLIPFMLSMWMFLSPVAYPSAKLLEKIPAAWGWVYELNPMAGAIEGFRWSLTGRGEPPLRSVAVSSLALVVVLLGGLRVFRALERTYADSV